MKGRVLAVLGTLATVGAAPVTAQAPGLTLTATAKPVGHISLRIKGPANAPVALTDTTTGTPAPLGDVLLDERGRATVEDAATWTCTRRRSFSVVTASGLPLSAGTQIRTPSCAHRFKLTVKRHGRARAGRPLRLKLTDTFRLGGQSARACITGPTRHKQCAPFRRNRATITPRRPGRFRVKVKGRGVKLPATHLHVDRKPGPVSLLAVGDSEMQILDDFLGDRLAARHVTVHKVARISTGISKPFMFDWPAHAKQQTAKFDPDVTVMFIGANEGFPFGDAQCCGQAWIDAYAKKVSQMIRDYGQDGRGSVYWCLLPAPSDGPFRRVFVAVNAAIRRAVGRNPGVGHLVDLPKTFTPGYRFQRRVNGTVVRQDDGVHLNVAGASLAADLIRRQLVRDGVV